MTPFLGGLLLNCRIALCLNLGWPVPGAMARVTTLLLALGFESSITTRQTNAKYYLMMICKRLRV